MRRPIGFAVQLLSDITLPLSCVFMPVPTNNAKVPLDELVLPVARLLAPNRKMPVSPFCVQVQPVIVFRPSTTIPSEVFSDVVQFVSVHPFLTLMPFKLLP